MRFPTHTLHAVTLAMLASPASAADKKPSSMPQMNPEWFSNQLFWLAVSFISLYLLVAYVIVPKLTRVVGGRKDTIAATILDAETIKNKALAAREHYESVEAKARKDAASMVADVTHKMNHSIAETQASMDVDLKKRISASDAAIADTLTRARAEVGAAAASLASEIYSSVLGDKVDAKQFEAAIAKQQG